MTTAEYGEFALDYYKCHGRMPSRDHIEFGGLLDETELLKNAFSMPPEEAIAYLKRKGFKITWSWQDIEEKAHQTAFTVAKAMSLDLLQTIRDKLLQAQREGIPFQQFAKEIEPKLREAGWWGKRLKTNPATGETSTAQLGSPSRLRTIYQTNLQSASMAGRYRQQQEAAVFRPYLQYIAILDRRTTELCNSLDGKIFPVDDPIWKRLYPPNHFNCRAVVVSLSKKDIERKKLTVESGKSLDKKLLPAEGFGSDPGSTDWQPDLAAYSPDLAVEYKRATARSKNR